MLSDGLKWKSGFTQNALPDRPKIESKTSLWGENLIKRYSRWHHFPQDGLPWAATQDRFFRKVLNFEKSKTWKYRKWAEMGLENWTRGIFDAGMQEISIRMQWEGSRTPKNFSKYEKSRFWRIGMKSCDKNPTKSLHHLPCKPLVPRHASSVARGASAPGIARRWGLRASSPATRGWQSLFVRSLQAPTPVPVPYAACLGGARCGRVLRELPQGWRT